MATLADAGFGDDPWQKEIKSWIEKESAKFLEMEKGVIWVFRNSSNELVGFLAFGPDEWFNEGYDSIQVIHYLGIVNKFQGHPKTGTRECRYSRQIMRYIMGQAKLKKDTIPSVGLFVHPENTKAINLYKDFGFEDSECDYIDEATGQNYQRYTVNLNDI